MKINSFVLNKKSLFSEYRSLKLKSFNCMKKTFKLKSFVKVLTFLFFSFSLNAQSNSAFDNISSENQVLTTALLKELDRKVGLYLNEMSTSKNQNLAVEQKEIYVVKLEKYREDIFSFIAHSLEDRCTSENRLNEIALIVKPFDSKLATKFEILHKENQQNLK